MISNKGDKRTVIFRTVIILVIIFIVGSIAVIRLAEGGEETADSAALASLADCLSQKGAKMYGAYWCSHCAKQKKLFGDAVSKINYIECAVTGSPREQAKECQEAGITSYPTWVFADGSKVSGEVSLKELAVRAGCPFAPADAAPAN